MEVKEMAKGVKIKPIIIQWAVRSSDRELDELSNKFKKINQWISEESELTVSEINKLSNELKIPFGYFFLQEPPNEEIELLKYRTIDSEENNKPSRELIDTIKLMETKQSFMRDTMIEDGFSLLEFVGSANLSIPPADLAEKIKKRLGIEGNWNYKNKDAFNTLLKACSDNGIVIMRNSVVGTSTNRKLNINEFRAFVLIDEYAPFVFLNTNDSYRAMIFSLCHELVHIWLGIDELYNNDYKQDQNYNNKKLEAYCNQVSAELLLPATAVLSNYDREKDIFCNIEKMVKAYNVSSLVVCIRYKNLKLIDNQTFEETYRVLQEEMQEKLEIKSKRKTSGGPSFYTMTKFRLGEKFINTVHRKAQEGRILYSEAYELVGARGKTYDKLIDYVEDKK